MVSVLEPIYGFSAMKKCYELLKGMTLYAFGLVFVYLAIYGVILLLNTLHFLVDFLLEETLVGISGKVLNVSSQT